jgi:hypothetical protein
MPTREQLHEQVDAVPEDQLDNAQVVVLEPNGAGPDHNDAQPGDIIDGWGNLSLMKRRSAQRKMKRLSQEEIAANGETLADAWGYKRKLPQYD